MIEVIKKINITNGLAVKLEYELGLIIENRYAKVNTDEWLTL